jgi:hypothetical protein
MNKTSTGTAYERVIDAVRNNGGTVIERGNGAASQCPAHPDRAPSLSVSHRRDGTGVILHCFAGCEYTSILDALGLTPRDLFDETKSRPAPCRPRPTAPPRPPATDTSRDYISALADRFGSLTEAGRARAETHHDPLCSSCRTTEPLGGPQWFGRFCADCAAGWAAPTEITEQQSWNALKQSAEAISRSRDWKQVAQRVRTGQ